MRNFLAYIVINNVCKRFSSSMVQYHAPPEYISRLRECYRLEEYKKIVVPIFKKALLYGNRVAVADATGEYSYLQLYMNSKRLSKQISNICGSGSSSCVGCFASNDVLTILNLWACWISGQVAIPLKSTWKFENLQEIIMESNIKLLIAPKDTREVAQNLAKSQEIVLITVDRDFAKNQGYSFNFNREIFMADKLVVFEGLLQNNFYTNADAMKIYSIDGAGDDRKLENYILTHNHINSEMKDIANVWNVSANDRVLNILPSFNTESFVSNQMFPLISGSTLQIHHTFDPVKAWSIILGINVPVKDRINLLVAEGTIFDLLIMEHERIFSKDSRMVEYIRDYCTKHIRLMICCGNSLSISTFSKWFGITGHSLFENHHIAKYKSQVKEHCSEEENKSNSNLPNTFSPECKFRIIDSENKVLMESYGASIMGHYKQVSGTLIGHLWISSPGQDTFIDTGKIVSYENGNIIVLGPSNKMKQT